MLREFVNRRYGTTITEALAACQLCLGYAAFVASKSCAQ
jgi:hypothetical protein